MTRKNCCKKQPYQLYPHPNQQHSLFSKDISLNITTTWQQRATKSKRVGVILLLMLSITHSPLILRDSNAVLVHFDVDNAMVVCCDQLEAVSRSHC